MKCRKCGFENEANHRYCKSCGEAIVYSYDKIHEDLAQKVKTEEEESLEKQTRQFLVTAICLFLFAVTFKIAFKTLPTCYYLPGSTQSAGYGQVPFVRMPPVEPIMLDPPEE